MFANFIGFMESYYFGDAIGVFGLLGWARRTEKLLERGGYGVRAQDFGQNWNQN